MKSRKIRILVLGDGKDYFRRYNLTLQTRVQSQDNLLIYGRACSVAFILR